MAYRMTGSQRYALSTAHRNETFFRGHMRLGRGCRLGECAMNREYDPFCLCKFDRQQSIPVTFYNGDRFEQEPRRIEGVPAGLQKLYDTGYMNSYLQTLFHLLPFRLIIYEWKFTPAKGDIDDEVKEIADALRKLFVRLQTTLDRSIDSAHFKRAIVSHVTLQQDPLSFLRGALNLVDRAVAVKQHEKKLQGLFKGRFRSTFKCGDCGEESSMEPVFHNFTVQTEEIADLRRDQKPLIACTPFEEKPFYDLCTRCTRRRKGSTKKQLIELPRILCFYLNRLVCDKTTSSERKSNNAVVFPATLDLKSFLPEERAGQLDEAACVYELQAVLAQSGDVAGQYVARIRVDKDGKWYSFNDSMVSPYDKLEESDFREAYMVFYENRRAPGVVQEPPIPEDQQSDPAKMIERLREFKKQLSGNWIEPLLASLKTKPWSDFVWTPADWFLTLFRTLQPASVDRPLPAPDMRGHLCPHGLFRLGSTQGLKAIEKGEMEKLLLKLGLSPIPYAFAGNSFCDECNWNVFTYGCHGAAGE